MNAKLNFLSKHEENRPFCAKALLLAVALWFACAAGALAQGIVEYALIINGVGEEPSIYINLEITGHEKSEEIENASDLVSACNRQTITEDILYKLKGNIVASQIFTVNKCLKLDLNGHSITSSATKCFNINDNAGLTIVDSSTDEQKGSINCTYNDDSDAIYINSGSKFIADGVTITCAKGSAITNVSGTAKISGCTIKDYSVSGIKNAGGTVTLNDWPTFSAASAEGVSDIWLHQGNTITIGSAITAAPTKEISVRVTDNNDNDLTADALPATITSGYAEKVKSDATTVIDPAEVFTYYKRDAYHIVTLDAATSSEAVLAAIPMEVTYIDPTKPVGQQECTANAYILDGTETKLGSNGQTTWYVSNTPKSNAKPNGITFTNDVTLAGDVCIILADGSAMTVQGSISGDGKSLYLYGQEGSTGSLDFWSIACNDVTITGGVISSENRNGKVIDCSNNISITGGQVTIPSSNNGHASLVAGTDRIYLGWTLPTDCYNIGIYDAPLIALQENKRFVAYDAATGTTATAVLSNSVSKDSENHYSSINGKWLRPVNGNIVTPGADVSVGTLSGTTFTATDPDFTITTDAGTESEVTTPYYIYSADTEQNPVTVTLSYSGTDFVTVGGLPEGTALNAVENQPMQRNFAMPAEDVALTTTAVTSFSVSGYYTYSGSAQTPSIKYGDNVIMNADDDFIVTGITKGGTTVTDAIDAGDYSLTIAGVGNYMGTASGIAFSINKKPVYNNSSTLIVDDAIYNGGKVIPEIELKDDNNNVIASSEYTVNIVSYDVFNHVIDYGNGNSLSSVMDVGIYYAVLYGKAESNYDIQTSTAFTVSPKPVGISWSTDALVYDGTDKAPAASATGVEAVDAGKVSVEVSVEGDHVKAGNYTATASALSGNRASNYKLPASSDAGFATLTKAFAISPKPVTVSGTGVTADNKTYDGTTDATVSGTFAFVDGMIIDGDDVSITGATGTFADKNVGTGKTVTISGFTLEGDDAGNYVLDTENQTPITATADIAAKTVTVTSGITASNKIYDGTTPATLSGSSAVISGKVSGDKLTVRATGKFGDKNAGTGKTVTISSISLTGSDKGNYVLASSGNQTSAKASITKKSLTVTADDKSVEYGDAAPTYTASYSGFVSDESKSNLSGSLSFSCSYTSSSNTGTYTITPSGHTSNNYTISYAAGTLTVGAKNVAYSGGTITQDENGYTVTLDEGTGSANTLPDDADLYSLTYSRTLTPPGSGEGEVTIGGQAANLYTVCLPFSPVTGTGVKYYTLSGVNGETVSFEEVTTPAANTPYLVAVTGSTNITESCTGEEVTSTEINTTTKDGYTFAGTFIGLKHAQAVGKHILQSHNKWCVVESSGSVFIPPFRAYIESTSGARMLTGSLDDEATGIDSLRLLDADGSEQWYDLNGRRISKPTRKGLYIHNGKVTTTK